MKSKVADWPNKCSKFNIRASDMVIPTCMRDLLEHVQRKYWIPGVFREYLGLFETNTFRPLTEEELTRVQKKEVKVTGNHPVFTIKLNSDGDVIGFKC